MKTTLREELDNLESKIYKKFNRLTKDRSIKLEQEITVAEYSEINGEFINRDIVLINDGQIIESDGDDTIDFWDLSIQDRLYIVEVLETL